MAKLKSVLNIEGTINELTFYKSQDGHLVRSKGGVPASRIATDPAFARTRENGLEFGQAAKAGKLLRTALRTVMANASDGRVTARVTQLMRSMLELDSTSERGYRNVAAALTNVNAKNMLAEFNFNSHASLGTVLAKPVTVDASTGVLTLTDLVPMNDLVFPGGADTVLFTGCWAAVSFGRELYDVHTSSTVAVAVNAPSGTVTLTPRGTPGVAGTQLFVLKVEFAQTVNGVSYPLSNGNFNCCCIVKVG